MRMRAAARRAALCGAAACGAAACGAAAYSAAAYSAAACGAAARAPAPGGARAPGIGAARALVVMIALASAGAAGAIAVLALDLDDRLERSVDVFVGTVSSTRAEAVDGEPWTVVTLEVERWLRSAGDDVDDAAAALRLREQVELAFLGGDAPGVPRREVAAMPRLQLGERLLLLTHGAGARFASSIVGFDQGLFRLIDEMWIDQDGNALGFDAGGVLVLGADGAVHGEELMSALSARLVQLGSRP